MSDPRFRPRDLSLEPDGFGRSTLRWKTVEVLVSEYPEWGTAARRSSTSASSAGTELSAAQLRIRAATYLETARLQHLLVYRIKQQLKTKKWTAARFASETGMAPDRLRKVLRGDLIMRVEDVMAADLVLGPVSDRARALERQKQMAEQRTSGHLAR